MGNVIKYSLSFAVIIGILYFVSYFKMLAISNQYFEQATKNMLNKDYSAALKGTKREKEDLSGYVFEGGFQQVVEIWRSDYAEPKPKIYEQSRKMVSNVIESMDLDTATAVFNKYNKRDQAYLSLILIRIADIHHERKNIKEEKETLERIIEEFPMESSMVSIASNRLESLK